MGRKKDDYRPLLNHHYLLCASQESLSYDDPMWLAHTHGDTSCWDSIQHDKSIPCKFSDYDKGIEFYTRDIGVSFEYQNSMYDRRVHRDKKHINDR